MHTSTKKERKTEILRQCHSLASGLGHDKRVCTVILSRSASPQELKQFPSKHFAINSILSRTMADKDLIKASIDTLSWLACLHLVHLKFFFFFLAVHLLLFVCVSSSSPYLPHPSLSLCFPTVIDSSLQSLTAAHQHLLRSGETERRCMSV